MVLTVENLCVSMIFTTSRSGILVSISNLLSAFKGRNLKNTGGFYVDSGQALAITILPRILKR